MAAWGNLGTSIKNDAKGLVGNIAKAVLVFPEQADSVDLKDSVAVASYGKELGMGLVPTFTSAVQMQKKGLTEISKAATTATKLAGAGLTDGSQTDLNDLTAKLDSGGIKYKKFTVQFNPSSIQITGRGGGRVPISNYGTIGKDQPGMIEYRALDPYITVNFTVMFDAMNNADAFMEERFTLGATTLVKNVATAAVGHEYTVRPYMEGFLAALRDEDHRTMIFQWGTLRYIGILNSVSGRYTMFNTAGNPIRAEVQLGMLMGGAPGGLSNEGYLDYWKKRYKEILNKNAAKDAKGDLTSMTTGNIKNQYTNLINL